MVVSTASAVASTPASSAATPDLRSQLAASAPGALVNLPGDAGTAILTGKVSLPGLKAAPSGVPVYIFSTKNQNTPKDKSVSMTLVAATVTDSSGRYAFKGAGITKKLSSLSSALQEVVVPAVDGSATVNLLADNNTSGGIMQAPIGGASLKVIESVPAKSPVIDLVLRSQPSPLSRLASSPKYQVTVIEKKLNDWQEKLIIGQTGSTTKNAKIKFTYSSGSSSTLGVGSFASLKVGSVKQTTTTTRSSSATQGFAEKKAKHNTYYRTRWLYGLWQIDTYGDQIHAGTRYEIRPISFSGGNYSYEHNVPLKSNNPKKYCVFERKGDSMNITTSDAITWSNAAEVNISYKGIGIKGNLSGKTGYNSKTKVRLDWTGKTPGYFCGINGAPGMSGMGVAYASDKEA